MNIALSSSGPGMDGILKGIEALEGADVLVGIPAASSSRRKGKINNAELMFIQTNGSPLKGIPPRPVIEPAIEQSNTADRIAAELAAACTSALDGDSSGLEEHLDRAGTIGESAAKRWFTDPRNDWPPNAPSTIRQKGSDRPLIDTGQLRRSITHIVEMGQASGRKREEDSDEPKSQEAGEGVEAGEAIGEGVGEAVEVGAEAVGEAAEVVGEAGAAVLI